MTVLSATRRLYPPATAPCANRVMRERSGMEGFLHPLSGGNLLHPMVVRKKSRQRDAGAGNQNTRSLLRLRGLSSPTTAQDRGSAESLAHRVSPQCQHHLAQGHQWAAPQYRYIQYTSYKLPADSGPDSKALSHSTLRPNQHPSPGRCPQYTDSYRQCRGSVEASVEVLSHPPGSRSPIVDVVKSRNFACC